MACQDRCLYCRMPLAPKHEHDHYPLASRHGGRKTICACVNCHTLKDRIRLRDWPDRGWAAVGGAWEKASAEERVFMAKMADQTAWLLEERDAIRRWLLAVREIERRVDELTDAWVKSDEPASAFGKTLNRLRDEIVDLTLALADEIGGDEDE
jgi:hypothetical protein